jgi:hypothetical protein
MTTVREAIAETITAHDLLLKKLWRIAYAEGRAEALKEAAKVCEDYENRLEGMRDEDYQCELAGRQMGAKRCAAAIRGLK